MSEDGEKSGFSSLSSLISKVEPQTATPGPKSKERQEPDPLTNKETSPKSQQPSQSQQPPQSQQPSQTPLSSGGAKSSGWLWLFGIVGAIVVFGAYNNHQNRKSEVPTSTYTPRTPAPSTSYPSSPTPSPSFKPSSPKPTQTPSMKFAKPSVGQNNVLSIAQLRWCSREKIRISTLRSLATVGAEVDQFNSTVSNYNSRCGKFRYRRGTLERARREVDKIRDQIVSNVKSEGATVKPSKSQRLKLTLNIQRLLKKLGLNPGVADGIYGPKTWAAIQAFQQRAGIPVDGQVGHELLDRLKKATASR